MPKVTVKTTNRREDYGYYEEIEILVDGEVVSGGSFGGEPEDNARFRDYAWVDHAIQTIAEKLGAEVEFVDETEEAE